MLRASVANSAGSYGSGASGVLVKKDQMTCAAAGTLAGGRGKECTPSVQVASASRVPSAHPDHVSRVTLPECVTTGAAVHWSVSRSRSTSVVTAIGSLLVSAPGL